jgi:drug/metabolite transporter (DMT)-like permease
MRSRQIKQDHPLTYSAFGVCSVIWGSTFLFISINVNTIDPVWAATIRLGLASAILTLLAIIRGQAFPRSSGLVAAVLYGLFGFGVNFPILYWAEQYVSSGLTAVLYSTVPLSTGLLALLFGMEKLKPLKLIGALVGTGGVVLIAGNISEGASIIPVLALLISATSYGVGYLLLKRGPKQSAFGSNAVGTFVGFLICLMISIAVGEDHRPPLKFHEYYPILYLTLAGSVGAYVAMAWLHNHWEATTSSFVMVVIPVVALFLGWLVKDESMSILEIVGTALVLIGVLVAFQADRRCAKMNVDEEIYISQHEPTSFSS